MTTELKDLEEVWASTTGGTVWVHKKDTLRPGNWVEKMIGGPGNVKLKLTVEEREHNQDLVAWGNEHQDPFQNGLLVRVLPKDVERGRFELTDDELKLLIKGGTDEEFADTIQKADSEVILRRMLALAAEDRATPNGRLTDLADLIKERYPQGRGSAFYEDLQEQRARAFSRL